MNNTTGEQLFPLRLRVECWELLGKKITQQGRFITSWETLRKVLNIIQHSSKFSLITLLPYALFKPFLLFSKLLMPLLLYHPLKWPSHLLIHTGNRSHLRAAPSTSHCISIYSSPGLHPCSSCYYNRMAIAPLLSRSHSLLPSMELTELILPSLPDTVNLSFTIGTSPPAIRPAQAKFSHLHPTYKATENSVYFQLFFLL